MKIESGQVAVITGAANGIGFALAEALATRGVSVMLSDVQGEAARAASDKLNARGYNTLAAQTDVSDADSVQALANTTLERFERVDLVCNNAGVACRPAPTWKQDPKTWRWLVDVALLGVAHGIHAFAPHMIAQGSGHILNTASVGGLITLPMMTPYNAAKHAVVGLTESLHIELKNESSSLGASVLCPGLVATALAETSQANRPEGAQAPDISARIADQAATHGTILTATDVARIALEGVEAGRVHIITHQDSIGPVRARIDSVLADLPVAR
jgi:NAD(P)-dependent dehydrogenase (short-subunit alcohol dehydrogenase family)